MVKRVCSHGNVTTEEREKEQNVAEDRVEWNTLSQKQQTSPVRTRTWKRHIADKVTQGTWLHKNSFWKVFSCHLLSFLFCCPDQCHALQLFRPCLPHSMFHSARTMPVNVLAVEGSFEWQNWPVPETGEADDGPEPISTLQSVTPNADWCHKTEKIFWHSPFCKYLRN